ncbi:MAG: class I SAM-dependent methyltransferase [Bacteroidales bacterium]|jgi:predicted O-methyltransferase YrrM|nr:class I SAM-dependent methyltransferase [Bacteroidales bacterium]HOI33248.1 class I SAM-dependent methyltransferase [Bacteroidales bacterium]
MSFINKTSEFIAYLFRAKGLHGLHSPFVYQLASEVLHDKNQYPEYVTLHQQRKRLLSNRNVIETVDFGASAGSKMFITYRARVQQLVKRRSHAEQFNQLLFRLSHHFKPEYTLEFGTAAGLGSAALALGNPESKVTTLEGCASMAQVAANSFERLKVKNVNIVIGNFNQTLPEVLNELPRLDLVFFDGNHQQIPTLDYFHHCLTKAHDDSIFIFDDIHWSAEMDEAWKKIQNSDQVSLTIDLFQFGLVFFRKGIAKQHFTIKM